MECELVEVSNMSANSSPHVTSMRMAVMKVAAAMMVTLLVNGGGGGTVVEMVTVAVVMS